MLDQGQTGRRLEVGGVLFLIQGMGRVIGADHIQPAIRQRQPKRSPVCCGFNGRITFYEAAFLLVVLVAIVEMMDAGLGRDTLASGGASGEQFQLPCRGQVQYM